MTITSKMKWIVKRILEKSLGRTSRAIMNPRRAKLQQERVIHGYLRTSQVKKLQLGAGSNLLDGWLNSEGFASSSFTHDSISRSNYVYLDVLDPFPMEDETFDYIFHEHVIEHLSWEQGKFMLSECFRVLKPGGKIRVATPDLSVFANVYLNPLLPDHARFLSEYVYFNSGPWSSDLKGVKANAAAFVINHAVRAWGHQFLYDQTTLQELLYIVGFKNVQRLGPKQSDDPHLQDLECRKDFVGIYDALILEASKSKSK